MNELMKWEKNNNNFFQQKSPPQKHPSGHWHGPWQASPLQPAAAPSVAQASAMR